MPVIFFLFFFPFFSFFSGAFMGTRFYSLHLHFFFFLSFFFQDHHHWRTFALSSLLISLLRLGRASERAMTTMTTLSRLHYTAFRIF